MKELPMIGWLVYNVFVFALYAEDKRRARAGAWRIPERVLLGSAIIMGGPGAYVGMRLIRHKTRRAKFNVLVPLAAVIQVGLIGYMLFM